MGLSALISSVAYGVPNELLLITGASYKAIRIVNSRLPLTLLNGSTFTNPVGTNTGRLLGSRHTVLREHLNTNDSGELTQVRIRVTMRTGRPQHGSALIEFARTSWILYSFEVSVSRTAWFALKLSSESEV